VTTTKEQELPFRLLGMEWRGGERLLSIAPSGDTAPEHVRLLGAGDRILGVPGDWQFDSIDGETAVFSSQGQPRRVQIP